MLTCKSLFGLGYRGERLIEPSRIQILRWLRVLPEREMLVKLGHPEASGPTVGETVKLRGSVVRLSVGPMLEETLAGTRVNCPRVS